MSKTERAELTVLCLIRRGEEILLQNRTKADWRGYALPGGHVEPGESIVDAVIREMQEETGLTIHHPRLCGIKHFPIAQGRYLVFLFETEEFEGQLRGSEEGSVEWVRLSRLEEYDAVEDLDTLIGVMLDPKQTEFQYLVRDDIWTVRIR